MFGFYFYDALMLERLSMERSKLRMDNPD